MYSLQEFVDPKNFKSYDELKAKLDRVLGLGGAAPASKAEDYEPAPVAEAAPMKESPAPKAQVSNSFDDDDDDSLSFFEKLAEED